MNDNKNRNHSSGKLGKVVIYTCFALFCMAFLISGYKVFTILRENSSAENTYQEIRTTARNQTVVVSHTVTATPKIEETEQAVEPEESIPVRQRMQSMAFEDLQTDYPNMVAWIFGEGMSIDYPVMRTTDNDYYLTHLYDGTVNPHGAIFVDYRNTGLFVDDNTIIYGHNMKNGSMFNALNEYKSQDFYDAHPSMLIYTPQGDYLVELICGNVEDGNDEFFEFSFDSFEDMAAYVSNLRNASTFQSSVELQPGDKLVSLCTCTYEKQNARYMLTGRVVELYEP